MVCLGSKLHLARLPASVGTRRACLRRPSRVYAASDGTPPKADATTPKVEDAPAKVVDEAPAKAVSEDPPKVVDEAPAKAVSQDPPKAVSQDPPKAASPAPAKARLSPLQKGGTLTGDKALGKDAAASTMQTGEMKIVDGEFCDDRWVDGRWDTKQFLDANGEVDWDAVIDAEMGRRALLEDSPTPSLNNAVNFDTGDIPWWAWVRRFHLPVAEKLNGRAAMLGYGFALIVENFSGYGLLEQQNSFFGKLLLHITVFAVLLIREVGDIEQYKNLIDEAFFYDRQWNASWEGKVRPSETED